MTYQGFEAVALRITPWAMLVAGVMYLVFGQVTVRRLRKSPATRDCLGMELLNGGDIVLVAQALTWPGWMQQRAENGCLGFMVARSRVIRQYTNRLDRILARLCYWSMSICLLLLLSSCFTLPRR